MTEAFARFDAFPHWDPAQWSPQFPPGRLDRIYLHWSGGDHETVYTAYHYCIAMSQGRIAIVETNDLRANMRDVSDTAQSYAAHTFGRNGFAAGLSVMAMRDARPDDFGPFPMTQAQIDAMCLVARRLARAYHVPVDPAHVMTHAEAALVDGYYGTGDDERWDIARLTASDDPLLPGDARQTGDALRARILGS
ncbi:MAG TPA: hypothetical protein VIK27_12310 [Candidatus Aquilonibacter sp.]